MVEHEEEVVLGASSPAPLDHKRKHEDLEPDAPEPPQIAADSNGNSESDSVKKPEEDDDSDAKRPRLEDKPDDVSAMRNGHQEKVDGPEDAVAQPPLDNNTHPENSQQPAAEAPEQVNDDESAAVTDKAEDIKHSSDGFNQSQNIQEEAPKAEVLEHPEGLQDPPADVPQQDVVSSAEHDDASKAKTLTRKMEVPNSKVGVLIGKAGDTIRSLQSHSGARIQITRDAEADLHAGSRPVELIGTLESINKAEKLIKDVIAEADAGGSPSLVARGFNTVQAAGAGEQIQIQVPNEKVGLIIGKGGETIKNLQTRSGARIQLIPQHLPEGDQSKERTVRVTGDRKQIEVAREMINQVMDQTIRRSPISSGYNQQAFRPRDPAAQWGPRGPCPIQQTGYDYQQRGPYQSQNPQYPPQAYGNYPPQQQAPRSNLGWEQRPQTTNQGPPHSGYDYYASKPVYSIGTGPSPAMGPPPSQANYNYGQPQASDYGQPAPYSQTAPPAQSYSQGYNEMKYENQVTVQHPYGGHGASQPSAYPQGMTHSGYGPQDQYGKSPYGMPHQGPNVQPYGQPRATQPGNVPYQSQMPSTQSYGPAASAQQPYPYTSSGQMQHTYPPYSSVPSVGVYNQPPPAAASVPGVYPQQTTGQPVSGYSQPAGQQAPGYAQVGPTGGYGQYPTSQPGYAEQATQSNAATYGYQGTDDSTYSGGAGATYAQPTVQPTYSQAAPNQPGYDQSIPQSGGYATAPASYGKSASPQPGYPQYDASQVYGAHH